MGLTSGSCLPMLAAHGSKLPHDGPMLAPISLQQDFGDLIIGVFPGNFNHDYSRVMCTIFQQLQGP